MSIHLTPTHEMESFAWIQSWPFIRSLSRCTFSLQIANNSMKWKISSEIHKQYGTYDSHISHWLVVIDDMYLYILYLHISSPRKRVWSYYKQTSSAMDDAHIRSYRIIHIIPMRATSFFDHKKYFAWPLKLLLLAAAKKYMSNWVVRARLWQPR